MTKSRDVASSAGACLVALVALAATSLPASAATTTVSFTLASGSLTVAQQDGTAFGAADGAGQVVVQDSRGGTLGWAATAVSTATSAAGEALGVTYASGPVTTTGSVTAISAGTQELGSAPAVVVIGTAVTGNNTATWTPTVSVRGVPATKAATVVTHSVL